MTKRAGLVLGVGVFMAGGDLCLTLDLDSPAAEGRQSGGLQTGGWKGQGGGISLATLGEGRAEAAAVGGGPARRGEATAVVWRAAAVPGATQRAASLQQGRQGRERRRLAKQRKTMRREEDDLVVLVRCFGVRTT